jgi:hypothetical protein
MLTADEIRAELLNSEIFLSAGLGCQPIIEAQQWDSQTYRRAPRGGRCFCGTQASRRSQDMPAEAPDEQGRRGQLLEL